MASLFGIPADRMKIPKIVAGSTVMDIEIEAPSACAGVVCGASGYCLEGECICNEGHRSPASCKGGGDCTCSQQTCASVTMSLLCTYYDYVLTVHLLYTYHAPTRCASDCLSCVVGSTSNCTSCAMPLPLLQPATGRCKATCPSGSFADPSGVCVQCDASCAACTGPGVAECSSCDPVGVTSHLRAGACVDSCGGAYYAEDQPLVRTCQPCHASCQACTGPRASQCSACKPDACAKSNCPPSRKPHLDGSSCLSTCPVRSL